MIKQIIENRQKRKVAKFLVELSQLGQPKYGLAKVIDDIGRLKFTIKFYYLKQIKWQLQYLFSKKWYLVSTNYIHVAIRKKSEGKALEFMEKTDRKYDRIPFFKAMSHFSTGHSAMMYDNREDALAKQVELLKEERDHYCQSFSDKCQQRNQLLDLSVKLFDELITQFYNEATEYSVLDEYPMVSETKEILGQDEFKTYLKFWLKVILGDSENEVKIREMLGMNIIKEG